MERQAAGLPVPASAPPGVVRRARRRQVLVGAIGGVAAVVVVVASFLGARELWVGTGQSVGGSRTETSTVNGVTISYPGGWHFENTLEQSGGDSPVLFILGNYAPSASFLSIPDDRVCRPTAAVLAVQETVTKGAALPPSWPVDLKPNPASPAKGCGSARTARWMAHGRLFQAYALFGREASARDRAALGDAFSSMEFGAATEHPHGGGLHTGGTVIARGTTAGEPWTVSVEGSGRDLTVSAETDGQGLGMGLAPSPRGRRASLWAAVMRLGTGPGVPRLVFGLASARVSSVFLEPPNGGAAKLYPIPGNTRVQVFVIPVRFIATNATLVAANDMGRRVADRPGVFYGWFSPWKISDTLVSSNTARRALAMIGAIDNTVSFSKRFSSGIGTVFVTTTSLMGASSSS
jgi:hypothetical protein